MTSISNLPLLNQSTVETTHSTLSNLTKVTAALKNGKLPTSEQLINLLKHLLNSDLIQPELLSSQTKNLSGSGKLSKRGKELVISSREVIESVIRLG